MRHVNIYLMSGVSGVRESDGTSVYILEFPTSGGNATFTGFDRQEKVTPNKSELLVLIAALKRLKEKCSLTIYTENPYLAAGFNGRIEKWQKNGWKTSRGKTVANMEEWRKVLDLLNGNEFEIRVNEYHDYKHWLKYQVLKERSKK